MTTSPRLRPALSAALVSLLLLGGCSTIQEARATPPDPDNPSDMVLLSGSPGKDHYVDFSTQAELRADPREKSEILNERVAQWCQENNIETEPTQECLLEYWTPDALRLSSRLAWDHWANNEVKIDCMRSMDIQIPDCWPLPDQTIPRLPGDDDPWWGEQAVSDPGRLGLQERPETRANLPDPGRKMMTSPSYDEWPDDGASR